ncbi:MAG TPA: hypothetical protein VHA33_25985, partial [Candidatus Angelobacter sp.]|nr:hypothetical protein [Candidatus Angelobacter sp.]
MEPRGRKLKRKAKNSKVNGSTRFLPLTAVSLPSGFTQLLFSYLVILAQSLQILLHRTQVQFTPRNGPFLHHARPETASHQDDLGRTSSIHPVHIVAFPPLLAVALDRRPIRLCEHLCYFLASLCSDSSGVMSISANSVWPWCDAARYCS